MSNKDYTKYSNKTEEKIEPVVEEIVETPEEENVEVVEETVETTDPVEFGVVVNCLKLNVRAEPNANADVVCVIDAATNLVVYEKESTDEFYKVCTESGADGFCMKKCIKLIP